MINLNNLFNNQKKYELLKQIGEGANGKVYSARRTYDGEIVAMKYLNFSDRESLQRFQNEIAVYQELEKSPFIVKIFDHSLHSFEAYLVMEFCKYGNARNQMSFFINNQVLTVALLLGVAKGIKQIHSLGTYHRDLKPDNLLLTEDGDGNYILKIGDAGMSCFLEDADIFRNATYTLQGTPDYIAPELFRGYSFLAESDIFSFGVTCHELLTGVRPIADEKVIRGPIELRSLLERMLNSDPNKRPNIEQTISAMKTAINQLKFNQAIVELGKDILKGGVILGGIFLGAKILDDLFGNK